MLMIEDPREEFRQELEKCGEPSNIFELLVNERDGAVQLTVELPRIYSPAESAEPGRQQHVWEVCGSWYMRQARWHEAISVYYGLYEQMLNHQIESGTWSHKGMPLVWLSECYYSLGCPLLSKRYIMLTACEDAIQDRGQIRAERGVYFRIVWRHD